MRHDDGEARCAQQRALPAHVRPRQQQCPGRHLGGTVRCAVRRHAEADIVGDAAHQRVPQAAQIHQRAAVRSGACGIQMEYEFIKSNIALVVECNSFFVSDSALLTICSEQRVMQQMLERQARDWKRAVCKTCAGVRKMCCKAASGGYGARYQHRRQQTRPVNSQTHRPCCCAWQYQCSPSALAGIWGADAAAPCGTKTGRQVAHSAPAANSPNASSTSIVASASCSDCQASLCAWKRFSNSVVSLICAAPQVNAGQMPVVDDH